MTDMNQDDEPEHGWQLVKSHKRVKQARRLAAPTAARAHQARQTCCVFGCTRTCTLRPASASSSNKNLYCTMHLSRLRRGNLGRCRFPNCVHLIAPYHKALQHGYCLVCFERECLDSAVSEHGDEYKEPFGLGRGPEQDAIRHQEVVCVNADCRAGRPRTTSTTKWCGACCTLMRRGGFVACDVCKSTLCDYFDESKQLAIEQQTYICDHCRLVETMSPPLSSSRTLDEWLLAAFPESV